MCYRDRRGLKLENSLSIMLRRRNTLPGGALSRTQRSLGCLGSTLHLIDSLD